MAELTVDLTYGKALFQAARELDKVNLITEEVTELEKLFSREPEFFSFFCSPIISAKEKKAVIRKVFLDRISPELTNLLCVLIDKGRGKHLPKIANQYRLLVNESTGHIVGTLYSVIPLDPAQLASFEEKTGDLLGKKVKLQNRTDSSLIGGVRIFVDGKLIDASVKTRLETLMERLATS